MLQRGRKARRALLFGCGTDFLASDTVLNSVPTFACASDTIC
jgi:hypothetical protein